MESLDEVIDAMIADRVIHRHRRIWLILVAVVVVLALVVLATGGWKEKKGRSLPTVSAPVTVTAGRWELAFTKAEIHQTPKDEYSDAKAELRVYFDLKNLDSEERASNSLSGSLLVLVPGDGADTIDSSGGICRGEIGWNVVYGLPPESCYTKFDVDPDYQADTVEIGVLGEQYEASTAFGSDDTPYWHNSEPVAVVRLDPALVVEKPGDK